MNIETNTDIATNRTINIYIDRLIDEWAERQVNGEVQNINKRMDGQTNGLERQTNYRGREKSWSCLKNIVTNFQYHAKLFLREDTFSIWN